jgi:hypothetical protein
MFVLSNGSIDEAPTTWMYSLLSQAYWGGNIVQVGTTPQAFMWETIPMRIYFKPNKTDIL